MFIAFTNAARNLCYLLLSTRKGYIGLFHWLLDFYLSLKFDTRDDKKEGIISRPKVMTQWTFVEVLSHLTEIARYKSIKSEMSLMKLHKNVSALVAC